MSSEDVTQAQEASDAAETRVQEQAVDGLSTQQEDRRRPRTGPIMWGALILVLCAYVTQQMLAPGTVDSTTWAIAVVIGLGLLLLLVGVMVMLRSRR